MEPNNRCFTEEEEKLRIGKEIHEERSSEDGFSWDQAVERFGKSQPTLSLYYKLYLKSKEERMNIEELADILDLEIIIRRYPQQNNRYTAEFQNTETKESKKDSCLCGTFGNGITPIKALNDYTGLISNKWLIVDATSKNRREFKVPSNLILFKEEKNGTY